MKLQRFDLVKLETWNGNNVSYNILLENYTYPVVSVAFAVAVTATSPGRFADVLKLIDIVMGNCRR